MSCNTVGALVPNEYYAIGIGIDLATSMPERRGTFGREEKNHRQALTCRATRPSSFVSFSRGSGSIDSNFA